MFMGMDVYESNQITDKTAVMFNKHNYMLYGVRRDMMLDSYEDINEGKKEYGICISSRIDLKVTLPTFAQRIMTSK